MDAKAHIDVYGYAVLKGALTADQANALCDRSDELIVEELAASGEHVYLDGRAQQDRMILLGFFRRSFIKPQQD